MKFVSTPSFSSGYIDNTTPGNRGEFSSIAIDPDDDYPAVAYYDTTNGNLMFAKWDGSDWDAKTTVDSSGNVGKYASLAFDSNGNPSIGYYDVENMALKWVYDHDDDGDWDESRWPMTLADNAEDDFGKFCSHDISGNSFGFAFFEETDDDLWYYEYDIVYATTAEIDVDSNNAVGQYCSLEFHSGVPGISYYDYTNHALKYAVEGSPNWSTQTVDSTDNAGQYSSLDYDGSGNPSIAYYHDIQYYGYLSWARWDPVNRDWSIISHAGGYHESVGEYMSHQWYGSTKCGLSYLARNHDDNTSWLEFIRWDSSGAVVYEADTSSKCGYSTSFAWVTDGSYAGDGWISHHSEDTQSLRYTFVSD